MTYGSCDDWPPRSDKIGAVWISEEVVDGRCKAINPLRAEHIEVMANKRIGSNMIVWEHYPSSNSVTEIEQEIGVAMRRILDYPNSNQHRLPECCRQSPTGWSDVISGLFIDWDAIF